MQKVTKFEGIQIEKVFFSNKNIYGNLMLSTCKQIDKNKTASVIVSPTFSDDKVELDNPSPSSTPRSEH